MNPVHLVGVGLAISLAVGCAAKAPAPAVALDQPIDQPVVLNGAAVDVDQIRALLVASTPEPASHGDVVCSYQVLAVAAREASLYTRCNTSTRAGQLVTLADVMAVDGTHYYAIRGGHVIDTRDTVTGTEAPYASSLPTLQLSAETAAARDRLLDAALAAQHASLGSRE